MPVGIVSQGEIFSQELDVFPRPHYAQRMKGDALSRNIRALRNHLGLTQTEFGERVGSAQANVSKWEAGVTPETEPLDAMAALAGCSISAFKTKEWKPPQSRATDQPSTQDAEDKDNVELREWDIAYGMGGGTYLDLPVTGEMHTFSRSWLRNFTHAPPDKVFLARGSGDSMFPTILDSDMVIIDTADREIRIGDKVWAVIYGTTGYIKRIRPMPDGSIKMLSDNSNVPDEIAFDGELSVVGRVVAIIRKQ